MKQNIIWTVALMGGLSLFAVSCVEEKKTDEYLRPVGSEIIFAAASNYENDGGTRTIYSGDITTVNGQDIERIDWEQNDRVAIVSVQQNNTNAEYRVTHVDAVNNNERENRLADIEAVGTKLTWQNDQEHVFYAMYPTASAQWPHQNTSASLDGTTVSGGIPKSVDLSGQTGPVFAPDMAYAYMVGYADNSCVEGTRVILPFTPAVTTFQFQFTVPINDQSITVTQFKLTASTYLTGKFSFNISGGKYRNQKVIGATWGTVNTSDTNAYPRGKEITVDFGTAGKTITAGSTLDFTIFALPIDQSGLTMEFTVKNGSETYTKKVELKDKSTGNFHTFTAAKKHIITNNLSGDQITYSISTTNPAAYAYTGASNTFKVTSYKQIGSNSSNRFPVAWKVKEYSTNNGSTWTTWTSNSNPSYLTLSSTSLTPPNASAQTITATMAATPRTGTLGGKAAVTGTESSPYNLSTHDILGNTISQTTANCYVITAPGWYMFPMVYGNARKDGGNNTQAYDPTNNSNSYFLNRMIDHKGGNMVVWVSNNSAFTIKTVSLLWQDSKGLVTNVGFHNFTPQQNSNGYIKFYVAPENINPGNAVIAVKDADGKIAWSWHIWVTDQDMSATTIRSKSFMRVNLGYCAAGTYTNNARSIKLKLVQTESPSGVSPQEAIVTITQNANSETVTLYRTSPHYQWGRKDPFVPPMGLGQTGNKTVYNASGSAITAISFTQSATSIQNGILNPTKMYAKANDNSGANDWLTSQKCNLWNYKQTEPKHDPSNSNGNRATDISPQSHGKTVYDPCPIGYTVPTAVDFVNFHNRNNYLNQFCAYSNYSTSLSNNGVTISSNFWGALGQRAVFVSDYNNNFTSAGANNLNSYGYYFTSVAWLDNCKNALYIQMGSEGVWMTQSAKSSGRSIRCVPE